jgi:anti-sigma factor RsiW
MQCEDAIEIIRAADSRPEGDRRAATSHAASCDDCQSALRALDALRALRDAPVPIVAEDAIERAIDRALTSTAPGWRRGFWSGLASGAAAAAAVTALAIGIWALRSGGESSVAVPEVRLSLNRPSDVTVTLDSPEPLVNAEVRVELRGAVALEGYAGQRELKWSTNLDRGINQLTLPVVAIDATGGQVLVEVTHGDKRRTFVLDVRAAAAG